ncbi:hypothetical protein N7528_005049 [Penicillium herquei]|nr:hypothetical protein N7528_005049 [Penicillium herquei]
MLKSLRALSRRRQAFCFSTRSKTFNRAINARAVPDRCQELAPSQNIRKGRSRRWPVLLGSGVLVAVASAATTYENSNETQLLKKEISRSQPQISYQQVQEHTSADDCWVILNVSEGFVYDVTNFLKIHPGGHQAILNTAGKEASELFNTLHPPDALKALPLGACLGPIDPTTLPEPDEEELSDDEIQRQIARDEMPAADNFFLLQEFEEWGERVLSATAWAYYRSAADEERTFYENRNAFQRYFFRPRILRGVSEGTTDTEIVGVPSAMPLFISLTAMAKLGHPLGEVNITKAAGQYGLIQMISSNASCGLEEIFAASNETQNLMFQLYLNKDRSESEKLIQRVENLGAKAIVFTVDVAWESKRTLDVRSKAVTAPPKESTDHLAFLSLLHTLTIDFQANTKLPVIVKGVQCLEDVQLCVEHGVNGVIISNHGGRQADYAPAPIDVLFEIRTLRPDLFEKIDIMIDGGIRSGADVVKALAMGAKAVGVGRPFLYANGTHGQEGVSRVIESEIKS